MNKTQKVAFLPFYMENFVFKTGSQLWIKAATIDQPVRDNLPIFIHLHFHIWSRITINWIKSG